MDSDDDIMSNLSSDEDVLQDDSDIDGLSGGEGELAASHLCDHGAFFVCLSVTLASR